MERSQEHVFFLRQVLEDVPVAPGVTLLLRTPALPTQVYFSAEATSSTVCLVEAFEDPAVTFDGVGVALRNINRLSAREALSQVFLASTIGDAGTLLSAFRMSTTEPFRSVFPLYLKPSSDYLLRFASATATSDVNMLLVLNEQNRPRTRMEG